MLDMIIRGQRQNDDEFLYGEEKVNMLKMILRVVGLRDSII